MPVTMQGLSPLVAVKINGTDTRLIADTGAFWSSLSPGKAAEFKLPLESTPEGMVFYGLDKHPVSMLLTHVKQFGLAGAMIRNAEFLVGGNEFGIDNAGLLGENILSRFDIELDLANGVMRLLRPKDCGKQPLVYWTKTQSYSQMGLESLEARDMKIGGMGIVNGSKIRVMFDTGAGASMLSQDGAARAGIKLDAAGVKAGGLQWGIGRHYVQTWIAPVASFKLGDEEIQNTHLRVSSELSVEADMLLGADFFLSHHVYVSREQRRIYFTYNGGPVFNLTTTPLRVAAPPPPAIADGALTAPLEASADKAGADAPAAAAPDNSAAANNGSTAAADAASFSRLGTSLAARGDFAAALGNLDHACALAPNEPSYLVQRGNLHLMQTQPELALKDFDAALVLQPTNLEALLRRGIIRLNRHDEQAARADIDAAVAAAPPQSDARFELAQLYGRLDSPDAAIAQLDLWIPSHPNDRKAAAAHNMRCLIRTRQGQALKQALDDCNQAVYLDASGATLDARARVYLRLGDYKNAIDDFNAALKMNPNIAWSYYGRGVAELRSGKSAQGRDDIAEARGLDARIDMQAARFGISEDSAAAAH